MVFHPLHQVLDLLSFEKHWFVLLGYLSDLLDERFLKKFLPPLHLFELGLLRNIKPDLFLFADKSIILNRAGPLGGRFRV